MKQRFFSWKIMMCWLAVIFLINCKDPYNPKLKSSDTNSLVVEGFIDGAAPVSFTISRSRMLTTSDTATRKIELNARVLIEDNHQNTFPLAEAGNGVYSSLDILGLNPSYQYRLHIFTSDGREYLSDLVSFKQSPPIDTIGWKTKDDGVQIFVNTYDPNNATRYYRWEYMATWEFHATYFSTYIYDPASNTVNERTEPVYKCWQSENATRILLASSAKLANDVISEMPLTYILPHDFRLSVLYSIWVKQYPLDANGYNYWIAMRNNTENVGSIFDPQPNETAGNIHCITNPSENVVGFINAGNSFEHRTYIRNADLLPGWNLPPDCPLILVPNIPDSVEAYFTQGDSPIAVLSPDAISASYVQCVDCTIRGTNIKPSFWP